jgi:hypothetical protein
MEQRLTLPATAYEMPAPDLDTAQQFRLAAEAALRTGEFEPMVALLAPDVEWVTPQHSLPGENGEWKELGNGRYSCELRALYRSKVSDDLSYSRDRSFELTIRAGKVSRYEMRFAG